MIEKDVLKKTYGKGPSMKKCMVILRKVLMYENLLYFVAIGALCNKKEYREV